MEQAVDTDTAELEFQRWSKAMGLQRKLKPDLLDEEDKKSLLITKDEVIGAIEDGRLLVDDKGQFVFTPSSSPDTSAITFYEPVGAAFMTRDKFGEGQDQRKSFSVLCEMTKQNLSRYGSMPNRDLTVCQSIMVLFLGR